MFLLDSVIIIFLSYAISNNINKLQNFEVIIKHLLKSNYLIYPWMNVIYFKNRIRLHINSIPFQNYVDASAKSCVHKNKHMGVDGFVIAKCHFKCLLSDLPTLLKRTHYDLS